MAQEPTGVLLYPGFPSLPSPIPTRAHWLGKFPTWKDSPTLGQYQHTYYQQIYSRRTGDSWTSQLITQCYSFIWTMWEHRNQVNTSDLTAQDRHHLRNLRNQLHRQFKLGTSTLLKADRWLLSHRGNLIHKSIDELTAWLDKITAARSTWKAQNQAQQDDLQAQRAGLQRWLHSSTQQ